MNCFLHVLTLQWNAWHAKQEHPNTFNPSQYKKCRLVVLFRKNVNTPNSLHHRRYIVWAVLILVFLPVAIFAAWTGVTLSYSYSQGERAGYVQKLSRKGWLCKTWEGELAMVTVPGSTPQMFNFSIRNESVAKQVLDAAGQRVALTYNQHQGVPTRCFGETEYFVTGVRPLGLDPAIRP